MHLISQFYFSCRSFYHHPKKVQHNFALMLHDKVIRLTQGNSVHENENNVIVW